MSPLRFLTSGESHGLEVLAILEGMPAGLALSPDDIQPDLARRQGLSREGKPYAGASARMKVERDQVEIAGGVMGGQTIGAPIALRVRNLDHDKWIGRAVAPMTIPRPGHADLTGAVKYGFDDLRYTLERASARETTARVAVGAACRKLLAEFGVRVGSYVTEIGDVSAELEELMLDERLERAEASELRCPVPQATEAMQARIREAMAARDTLGGVFEVVALGVPPGLGSHVHWDRRLTARLAAAVMSIHAIKGVEIGDGFANARKPGTLVHDEIFVEEGWLVRRTNRAGGLEGGISNGQPIVVRAAMKPLSTTLSPLRSVDLATGAPAPMEYERSDFCAVPRACVVGEAMVCFVLADALLDKLGGDSIAEMRPRFETVRQLRLEDLQMLGEPTVFWP